MVQVSLNQATWLLVMIHPPIPTVERSAHASAAARHMRVRGFLGVALCVCGFWVACPNPLGFACFGDFWKVGFGVEALVAVLQELAALWHVDAKDRLL